MLKTMQTATRSKTALYIAVAVSVLMVFGYLMTERLEAVAFFALTGYIAWQFSRNMVIVLAAAFTATAIATSMGRLRQGKRALGLEGFENEDEKSNGEGSEEGDDHEKADHHEVASPDASTKKNDGKQVNHEPVPHEKESTVGEVDREKTAEKGVSHLGGAADIHEKLVELRAIAADRKDEAGRNQKTFEHNMQRVENFMENANKLVSSFQSMSPFMGK